MPSRLPTNRKTTRVVMRSCVTIEPPDMLLFSLPVQVKPTPLY
jgi:hypothetical protein